MVRSHVILRVHSCVRACVCVPRSVSTALTALMNRGLLDSEYSTKTMRSFRAVLTSRRDCGRKDSGGQDPEPEPPPPNGRVRTDRASCEGVEPLQGLVVLDHAVHPVHKQHDLAEG